MTRVVVDPITRIEGHLRIEAVVENASSPTHTAQAPWCAAWKRFLSAAIRAMLGHHRTRLRRLHHVHALTSVRAVEAPWASPFSHAELIRDIMMTTQYVQDHVVHFYHLHALDWVDIVNALKADPRSFDLAQSFSQWTRIPRRTFPSAEQDQGLRRNGLGIFANGYWGHPAYKLPPEVNLIAWRTIWTRSNGRGSRQDSTVRRQESAPELPVAAFPAPSI